MQFNIFFLSFLHFSLPKIPSSQNLKHADNGRPRSGVHTCGCWKLRRRSADRCRIASCSSGDIFFWFDLCCEYFSLSPPPLSLPLACVLIRTQASDVLLTGVSLWLCWSDCSHAATICRDLDAQCRESPQQRRREDIETPGSKSCVWQIMGRNCQRARAAECLHLPGRTIADRKSVV